MHGWHHSLQARRLAAGRWKRIPNHHRPLQRRSQIAGIDPARKKARHPLGDPEGRGEVVRSVQPSFGIECFIVECVDSTAILVGEPGTIRCKMRYATACAVEDNCRVSAPMPIPNVTKLLANCWAEAEKSLLLLFSERHHDMDEVFITDLFRGEFRRTVQLASSRGEVKHAFLHDLEHAFPLLQNSAHLEALAIGISATVFHHPPNTEAKTGGDIGIVIIRPSVTEHFQSGLEVDLGYMRGLLCQAKVTQRQTANGKTKWGELKENQKTSFPDRLQYLSLLLYRYIDNKRQDLAPFQWQMCANYEFKDIIHWLKSDEFPDLQSSESILMSLGNGVIGTDDRHVVREFIAPPVRNSLIVKIGWPPGQEPPSNVHILQEEEQYVRVYRQ